MNRALQQSLTLLAGVLLCTAVANAQEEPAGEQRRIREIRLYIANIYTEEEANESSWARFTDRYHITTRESVIRNKLLFEEGDVLDEELLEATERSLRRNQYINVAEVLVVPVDDQSVDIEVHTKDVWSLMPGLDIDGGGGLARVTGSLTEVNLFGYGKKLFAEARWESDIGTTWKFDYSDYQMFNSRWVGGARYATGPLIEFYSIQARMPLYSPDSKWAYGGSAYNADKIERLFENGEESSRFAKDQSRVEGFLKRSFGERYHKIHVEIATYYKKADFSDLGSQTTEPPPPDQANVTPFVSIDTEDTDWGKFTYVDKMGTIEDSWLGRRYGGKLGYGIPVEDGFELWDTRVFLSSVTTYAHGQLLKLYASVRSEVVRNTIVSASARYYRKFSGHTVATNLATTLGYDLDSSVQFSLGADSGLRGYPARYFTGDKRLLMNLEDRQFWGNLSIGPKLSIGTVVFVDAGNVWKEEEEVHVDDMNWSTGFGLRLGFLNLPGHPILRLDFGWAIGGEDNFAVTIGQEQQF
jgi:hypothetical protein